MRKIILLLLSVLCISHIRAQRFFYIETGNPAERPVREDLKKASQYITDSPLASDFIIKTSMIFRENENSLNLKIYMQDTLTSRILYQADKQYDLGIMKTDPKIVLKVIISNFIENNMDQIIGYANDIHSDKLMKYLKTKKDHT